MLIFTLIMLVIWLVLLFFILRWAVRTVTWITQAIWIDLGNTIGQWIFLRPSRKHYIYLPDYGIEIVDGRRERMADIRYKLTR